MTAARPPASSAAAPLALAARRAASRRTPSTTVYNHKAVLPAFGQSGPQLPVPVCRGQLGPGVLIMIGANRPARLAMRPRACGRQSGPSIQD
jgi:hypothetical protein